MYLKDAHSYQPHLRQTWANIKADRTTEQQSRIEQNRTDRAAGARRGMYNTTRMLRKEGMGNAEVKLESGSGREEGDGWYRAVC